MNDIEQKARELLAAEFEKMDRPIMAGHLLQNGAVTQGASLSVPEALSAIIAALSQQQAVQQYEALKRIAESETNDDAGELRQIACDALLGSDISQQQAVPEGWRLIAEAPENRLCVVGWVDDEDGEERHQFDYIEDGLWVNHQEFVDHADAVAPACSQMPARDAPYQWFIEIPAMLAARPEVQP
ncbi:hypothetical protein FHR47_002284 [Xanthomonas arboricola]|uniref:hypothetical protein n=1 Tax=Xanthomonas cannabis TaxID=1885674 RepID=UPI001618B02F|nr:hypothetical protein [Xanthomonas cannabis]MBB3802036.1 hypothetical protein [Xanthomonas cannabis]